MIRTALIGYGLGGRSFHAPIIAVTPGMRLEAIVTSNAARRQQALADHPRTRLIERAEALFAHPSSVDLVVITTPNRTHVALARAALKAGLPVVVDKPLAPTSAEALDVVADAERRGLMLTVYQNRRWDGDFRTVARLIREDALGAVHRFESRFERWRPELRGGWRESADPADAGGLLYDLGAHLIDQALQLFGPVADVYAEADARRPGAQVDDDVFVALTHVNGVRSHLWMSVLAADRAPRFRVFGMRGTYAKFGMDVQEEALRAGQRPGAPEWGIEPREHWGMMAAARQPTLCRASRVRIRNSTSVSCGRSRRASPLQSIRSTPSRPFASSNGSGRSVEARVRSDARHARSMEAMDRTSWRPSECGSRTYTYPPAPKISPRYS